MNKYINYEIKDYLEQIEQILKDSERFINYKQYVNKINISIYNKIFIKFNNFKNEIKNILKGSINLIDINLKQINFKNNNIKELINRDFVNFKNDIDIKYKTWDSNNFVFKYSSLDIKYLIKNLNLEINSNFNDYITIISKVY